MVHYRNISVTDIGTLSARTFKGDAPFHRPAVLFLLEQHSTQVHVRACDKRVVGAQGSEFDAQALLVADHRLTQFPPAMVHVSFVLVAVGNLYVVRPA